MQILSTHRTRTPTRTIDLAPGADPDTFARGEAYELVPMVRLIADEGKTLTNGTAMQPCVITESAEGWTEIDEPPTPEEDDKADMQAAINIYEGGTADGTV